jgi:hypothetical protein
VHSARNDPNTVLHILLRESQVSSKFSLCPFHGNWFGIETNQAVFSGLLSDPAFEICISPVFFSPIFPESPELELGFILRLAAQLSDLRIAPIKR